MSLIEVREAIIEGQIEGDITQTPGMCRQAAKEMKKVAQEANKSCPPAKIEIVKWEQPDTENPEAVHFALKATDVKDRNNCFIFNPVPTALFPQYNGELAGAPGKFSEMRPTTDFDKTIPQKSIKD